MTKEEKATMIAKQCLPCSEDFYSGMYQGVLITLTIQEEEKEPCCGGNCSCGS